MKSLRCRTSWDLWRLTQNKHNASKQSVAPQFLGLPLHRGSFIGLTMGKGVVTGTMDSGVMPDHPSFRGAGMLSLPAKWNGRCNFKPFQRNNKLIDARMFNSSAKGNVITPPIDDDGHGTHSASTAAGGFVEQANMLGMAEGTTVGIAPYSHLAIRILLFARHTCWI